MKNTPDNRLQMAVMVSGWSWRWWWRRLWRAVEVAVEVVEVLDVVEVVVVTMLLSPPTSELPGST